MFTLYTRYLLEYALGCPLNALIGSSGAAIKFEYAVKYSVGTYSPPAAGKRLGIPKVKTAVSYPVMRGIERLYYVRKCTVFVSFGDIGKFLEKLTFENIPVAVQPRFFELFGQSFELPYLFGLAF